MITREQFERFLQESGLRPTSARSTSRCSRRSRGGPHRRSGEGAAPHLPGAHRARSDGSREEPGAKGGGLPSWRSPLDPERVDAAETVRLLKEVYLFRGRSVRTGSTITASSRTRTPAAWSRTTPRRRLPPPGAAAQGIWPPPTRWSPRVELTPGRPVMYSLAILKLDQRDWAGAEQWSGRCWTTASSTDGLHRLLGRAYEGQDRLDEAEAQYRRSLELSPGSFESMRDLFSLFWVIKGDKPAGLAVLDDWIRRHPEDRMVRSAAGLRRFDRM